tara:strand:+ start:160 stop:1059 length:900 start_codon:yes stop_codon:yes gene_type:complete
MTDIRRKNDIDLYDIIGVCLKNKLTLFLTMLLFCILGFIIDYRYIDSNNTKLSNIASINILIQENDRHSYKEIVDKVNIKLSSSYYYENWSNVNKNLSNLLLQKNATQLTVLEKNQIVVVEYDNEDNLKAIISYIDYVVKLVSKKIYQDFQNQAVMSPIKQQENLAKLKNQINIAKQNSIFLESYIKQNKNVEVEIILTLLKNKNQIEENLLFIDQMQSDIKKINQNTSKNKSQYNKEIEKIQVYKNLITVGRINKDSIKVKNNLNNLFIPISLLFGLFFGFFFVVIKNDYLIKKQSEL